MKQFSDPIKFYAELLDTTEETSMIFGFIPMFKISDIQSIFLYFGLIVFSSYLDSVFFSFYLISIITFFMIFEHRRLSIMRECIMELCMTDDIHKETELQKNSEFLKSIGEEDYILECDRIDIFLDNLHYCNSRSKINYIKKHYRFLISIVFVQVLVVFLCTIL